MNIVVLQQPKRIVFGNECAMQCVDEVTALGKKRFFIVTSPPIVPLVEPVAARLKEKGAAVEIYDKIEAEPDIAIFHDALNTARAFEPDAVLGLGGGSALDVSKLVAALVDSEENIKDLFGIGLLKGRNTYLACLPTTSGTGSEVSPNAILLDEDEELKKGVVSPYLMPDAAFVDPLLTLTVPPGVTAATGVDAMVHCIEAYTNKFAHPTVDLYALQGTRLIAANLERAVKDGKDVEARANLSLGSLYGGLCLGPVNTAAVHALAYPLGGEFHIAHGVSNAVLLPHVTRFNLPAAVERHADVAMALGCEAGATAQETAERGLERMFEFVKAVGIPQHLEEFGVKESDIPHLATEAMKVTRLLKNNPREVTAADAEEIYKAAF